VLFLFFLIASVRPVCAAIDFQISDFHKEGNFYTVNAQITGAASDSSYFVQAMFTQPDATSYFGFTWGQKGDWFSYLSSPEPDFIKANFPSIPSEQTIKIILKPDTESSKYKGPGEYTLKLKRYTGESTSGTYSNSLSVTLSDSLVTPDPTQTSAPTTSPTSSPTATSAPASTSTPTKTPVITKSPTKTPTVTKTPANTTSTPTVSVTAKSPQATMTIADLSVSSPSDSPLILGDTTISAYVIDRSPDEAISATEESSLMSNKRPPYKTFFIIGALVASGSGGLLYFRLRSV